MVANKVHADMESALSAISKSGIVSHETLLRKFKEFTAAGNKIDQNQKQRSKREIEKIPPALYVPIIDQMNLWHREKKRSHSNSHERVAP